MRLHSESCKKGYALCKAIGCNQLPSSPNGIIYFRGVEWLCTLPSVWRLGLESSGAAGDMCWPKPCAFAYPYICIRMRLSRLSSKGGTAAGRCASAALNKALAAGHRFANIVSLQVFRYWCSCTNCCLVATIVQAVTCGRAREEVPMRRQSTKGSKFIRNEHFLVGDLV